MQKLSKLKRGDRVAIVSPSFAAPGKWPHVYALALERLQNVFELEPVAFPYTAKIGATKEERSSDLVAAFENRDIKAVIASLGGDDQVTYIKNLPVAPFVDNPKPFFGFSDNSHFANFLFLNEIPSFYGASFFTQFAMQGEMDEFTVTYLKHAFFDEGEFELSASATYTDQGLNWEDESNLAKRRQYQKNDGWYWDGTRSGEGLLWGGCIESVDEMLRHSVAIPSLEQFKGIVLMLESSEEIPSADYVRRVIRAFGERGILTEIKGMLIGRPKAWEFDKPATLEEKVIYSEKQREAILKTVRAYNQEIPIVQNMDFGHTDPQIPMPYGGMVRVDSTEKRIFASF